MTSATFFKSWFAFWAVTAGLILHFGGLLPVIVFNLAFSTINIIGATITMATGRGPWRTGS